MTYDEYNTFVLSFVDQNEYPIRDNPLLFNESIKLQISEIYSDKHLNMFLPEFLEGMCRAIDKASPIPNDEKIDDWNFNRRFEQPLIKNHTNDLYIIDYENNPFYQGYIIKGDNKNRNSVVSNIS